MIAMFYILDMYYIGYDYIDGIGDIYWIRLPQYLETHGEFQGHIFK